MGRKTKNLPVRDELLILTNGKRSEKNYFEALRANYSTIYQITVRFLNSDPLKLVRYAVKQKSAANRVWCIFDKDEFTDKSIYQAMDLAKTNGIGVAFSNAAFEVWLIDHFKMFENEKDADSLQVILDKLLKENEYSKGYEKNDAEVISKVFLPRLDDAIHNADVVHQKRVLEYKESGRSDDSLPFCSWNSYTNVHKLVEALKLENKN